MTPAAQRQAVVLAVISVIIIPQATTVPRLGWEVTSRQIAVTVTRQGRRAAVTIRRGRGIMQ